MLRTSVVLQNNSLLLVSIVPLNIPFTLSNHLSDTWPLLLILCTLANDWYPLIFISSVKVNQFSMVDYRWQSHGSAGNHSLHILKTSYTCVHCRLSPETNRPTSCPWSAFYNSLKISHLYFIHTTTSDAKTPSTFNVPTYIHCGENRLKYTQ